MSSQQPDSLPQIPELKDDFEFVRELGRGGTAVVYLARDRALGRDVAIKLIRPSYLQDPDAIARLEREARTVGKLQHPNIVLLLGTRRLGEKGLALILQFVPGQTLKDRIRKQGPLPLPEVERILRQVGQALQYAHGRRIVHRDIKPENVYLDEDAGLARLADFGIARPWDSDSGLTLPGTAIGTPTYMSPEQVDGADLDGRSDIYSLGLLGYEMLTGRQPWEGESLYNVIYKQKHEALPSIQEARPHIPETLLHVVDRALRKEPAERWANVEAFLEALGEDPEATAGPPGADRATSAEEPALSEPDSEGIRRPPSSPPDFFAWQAPAAARAKETSRTKREAPRARKDARQAKREAPQAEDVRRPTNARWPKNAPQSKEIRQARDAPPPTNDPQANNTPRAAVWVAIAVLLLATGVAALATTGSGDGDLRDLVAQVFTGADDPAGAPGEVELERPGNFDAWAADPGTGAEARPDTETQPGIDLTTPGPVSDPDQVQASGSVPPGTGLTLVQGEGQAGPPGFSLPQTIVFQVEAPDGSPVSGATIQLEVTSGGGTVQPARPVSDAAGFGAFQWSLGQQIGIQTVEAALEGTDDEPVTLTAEAAPLLPAGLELVAGSGQEAEAGTLLTEPVRIRVVDPNGRPVPGLTVSFQVSEGAGSVTAGTVTTDEDGEASAEWTLGPGPGEQALQISVPEADLATTVQAEATLATLSPRPVLLAGGTFSCALGGGGEIRCWGSNSQGQLGDGSGVRRASPGPAIGSFTRLAVGISHACALDEMGTPHCWGDNTFGQLGDGSTATRMQPRPVADVPPLVEVTAGAAHTCGVARTGAMYCWGDNASGQLGDGSTTLRTTPASVEGGYTFRQVAAGWRHTCAITADGAAVCWGTNGAGQLGRSGGGAATTPGPVDGGHRFTALSAGSGHTCGLTSQGDVLCWGSNQFGQLGDGSTEGRWEPASVEGDRDFQDVAVGAQHSCAIADTGAAFCWGRNIYGQLGDGSTTDRPLPTSVEGSIRFSQLHALGSHTCGRSPAGDLICWGYNSDGQIGDGTRTNRPAPVQVDPSGS
jgi:serine/threonine protein kinase/alpha-tubulin suppressor-like RCC1 family protein